MSNTVQEFWADWERISHSGPLDKLSLDQLRVKHDEVLRLIGKYDAEDIGVLLLGTEYLDSFASRDACRKMAALVGLGEEKYNLFLCESSALFELICTKRTLVEDFAERNLEDGTAWDAKQRAQYQMERAALLRTATTRIAERPLMCRCGDAINVGSAYLAESEFYNQRHPKENHCRDCARNILDPKDDWQSKLLNALNTDSVWPTYPCWQPTAAQIAYYERRRKK